MQQPRRSASSLSSLPAHQIRPPDCVIYFPVNKAAKGETQPRNEKPSWRHSWARQEELRDEAPWPDLTCAGATATSSTASVRGQRSLVGPSCPTGPPEKHLKENTASPQCFRAGAAPGLPQQGGAVPSRHVPCCPFFPAATIKNFPWAEWQARGPKPKSAAVGLTSSCLLAGVVLYPTREPLPAAHTLLWGCRLDFRIPADRDNL